MPRCCTALLPFTEGRAACDRRAVQNGVSSQERSTPPVRRRAADQMPEGIGALQDRFTSASPASSSPSPQVLHAVFCFLALCYKIEIMVALPMSYSDHSGFAADAVSSSCLS